jgi:hypothetical protein
VRHDELVAGAERRDRLGRDLHVLPLVVGGHRLAPAEERVAAESHQNSQASTATRSALIVCMRFSALVEHHRRLRLEHVVRHLEAVHAVLLEQLLALRRLAVVEGGEAVQDSCGG